MNDVIRRRLRRYRPVLPGVQMFSKQKEEKKCKLYKIFQQKKFNTKEMGTQKEEK